MRSQAYTIQQTLTTEAASVLKHSLALARRREHSQVTPLHVVANLLVEQLVISILDEVEDDDSSSVFHCYAGDPSGVGGFLSSPSSSTRGTFWQTQPCFSKEDDMKLVAEVLYMGREGGKVWLIGTDVQEEPPLETASRMIWSILKGSGTDSAMKSTWRKQPTVDTPFLIFPPRRNQGQSGHAKPASSLMAILPTPFASQTATPLPRFRIQRSCNTEFDGCSSTGKKNPRPGPNLDSLRNPEENEVKITLSLGNSLFSDSGKLAEHNIERMLKQGNARQLLHDNVPWKSETIPAIVEGLFHSKSAVRDTWLLLHENDTTGKRRMARAIAEAMFGSSDLVINLNTRAINSAKSSYSDIFARISKDDEKLVILMENIEMADKQIVKFLSNRFEMGKISDSSQGRAQDRGQVVYILTKGDSFTAAVDNRKRQNSVVQMAVRVTKTPQGASIDLKRKAHWDLFDEGNGYGCLGILKKELCNVVFDLNEKASGEIADKDAEEVSPNSNDLTGESGRENTSAGGFHGMIENICLPNFIQIPSVN